MKFLLMIFSLSLCYACQSKQENIVEIETNVVNATAYSLTSTILDKEHTIRYLQYLPKDYNQKKDWPLLLFLHGSGERGEDLSKVAIQGPPKLASMNHLQEFVIIAPQCPDNDYWDTWTQQTNLISLLNHSRKTLNIDKNRVYITGLSMGGFGTWHLATTLSNEIAAAVPICGGGNVWTAEYLKDVPIWAFHGAKDDIVPISYSEEMVNSVNKNGGDAKLTIFPELEHNSWDKAYEQTDSLYQWLLNQDLKKRN